MLQAFAEIYFYSAGAIAALLFWVALSKETLTPKSSIGLILTGLIIGALVWLFILTAKHYLS
jgi:hypothetical protein